MDDPRELPESPKHQRQRDVVVYEVDVVVYGGSPTVSGIQVTDMRTNLVVTTTVMPSGSASIASGIISLPPIRNLTSDRSYLVELLVTVGPNTFDLSFRIICHR